MKRASTAIGLSVAAAIAGLAAGAGWAQDKAEIIQKRQDLMKQQSREWVVIRNYTQGKASQQDAAAAADALVKSVPGVANLFPPGTGIGDTPEKTRAKPEIWSDHAGFLEADKTVGAQVAALDAAVKTGDPEKAAAALKELDGCNACHKKFRAPSR